MYKNYRYVNAGENEIHRWGHKTIEHLENYLKPNENGFISIPADGGKHWTIGTSNGKFGEFAKWNDTIFSVNKAGRIWAKVGTEKADKLVQMIENLIEQVKEIARKHSEACDYNHMMHQYEQGIWTTEEMIEMGYIKEDDEE